MTSSNATIILVPGAFYNPDYFSTFQAQLEKLGFHTIAIALPSVGSDDPASCSAQKDADFIRNTAIVPLVDEGKQVVILMHSYGAIPVSAAARGLGEEQRSREGLQGGVVGLIHISAFLAPADTTPLAAMGGSFPPEFAVIEGVSNTSTILDIHSAHVHLFIQQDQIHITIPGAIYGFYNDLPQAEAEAWASKLLTLSVHVTTSQLEHTAHTTSEFATRRAFIYCEKDNALPLVIQKAWVEAAGIGQEYTALMPSGHSPFLSMPDTLAEVVVVTQIGKCGASTAAANRLDASSSYRMFAGCAWGWDLLRNCFAQVEDLDYSQDSLGEVLISDRNRSCRLSKGPKIIEPCLDGSD